MKSRKHNKTMVEKQHKTTYYAHKLFYGILLVCLFTWVLLLILFFKNDFNIVVVAVAINHMDTRVSPKYVYTYIL